MSQPATPLTEQEQQQLVRRIGRAMLPAIPPGWQRIRAEYRAAGRHIEVDLAFAGPDGQWRPVRPPMDVVQLFGQLRVGMYDETRGTWLSAVYEIEAPSAFAVDFNAEDEPRWRNAPPVIGFQDELRTFPRADERIPDWWRQRVGLPPLQQAGAELRTAHVYDGRDQSGRPVVNRPPVDPQLREALLAYLEAAPVVLAARDLDVDEFAPGDRDVPLNFRTDGTWIWAGAVPHYLRKHGLPPQPELVAHIVGRGFRPVEVDEATKGRAVELITGQ
ncbi:hypothetical protein [Saccharothrix coeruleofusca]|uniref:Ferredoxin n=1 Tax=Saccharothrix coeruleofusca TaxID=33919 RepID=A0A918AMU1_9PSEU|nr:hypothetical protein [Saccharothrix coeruleofusca]MBP2338126.1 hypothetical protein [Saccharothrix coeruleofusca]GGP50590.1 hypothetical protein GCM10010185_23590 [Saccharothrix coeruleofusca]